jgi:hypothetical protein
MRERHASSATPEPPPPTQAALWHTPSMTAGDHGQVVHQYTGSSREPPDRGVAASGRAGRALRWRASRPPLHTPGLLTAGVNERQPHRRCECPGEPSKELRKVAVGNGVVADLEVVSRNCDGGGLGGKDRTRRRAARLRVVPARVRATIVTNRDRVIRQGAAHRQQEEPAADHDFGPSQIDSA